MNGRFLKVTRKDPIPSDCVTILFGIGHVSYVQLEEIRLYLKYQHVDITSEIKVYVLFFDRFSTLPKFLLDHQPRKNLEVGDAAIRRYKPKSRLEEKKQVISNGKPVIGDLSSDLFIVYKHISFVRSPPQISTPHDEVFLFCFSLRGLTKFGCIKFSDSY